MIYNDKNSELFFFCKNIVLKLIEFMLEKYFQIVFWNNECLKN